MTRWIASSIVVALTAASCSLSDDAQPTDASMDAMDAAPQEQDAGHAGVDAAVPGADAGGRGGSDASVPDGEPDAAQPGPASIIVLEQVWDGAALPTCAADTECEDGFSCLSGSTTAPPICAPPCDSDAQCNPSEFCYEGFGEGENMCVALLADEKQFCGLPFRTLCQANMGCLPLSNSSFVGVCFRQCDPLAVASGCESPRTCVSGWTDRMGAPLGACGVELARGQPCDAVPGDMVLCAVGDVCAPSADSDSPWTCREQCELGEPFDTCLGGACRPFGYRDETLLHACY